MSSPSRPANHSTTHPVTQERPPPLDESSDDELSETPRKGKNKKKQNITFLDVDADDAASDTSMCLQLCLTATTLWTPLPTPPPPHCSACCNQSSF